MLTQGGLFSQRDPSKLRQFNQQIDEHAQYQDAILPEMPFEYDHESLVISPTIRTPTHPVPVSMEYQESSSEHKVDDKVSYPKLEYMNPERAAEFKNVSESLHYHNVRTKAKVQPIGPSHHNINVRLQRLFYSDKAMVHPSRSADSAESTHQPEGGGEVNHVHQPSDEHIRGVLEREISIDAADMMMDKEHGPSTAELKKHELEVAALSLSDDEEEEEDEEEGVAGEEVFDFGQHLDDMEQSPNFKELFPDDTERSHEIDKFLHKAPEVEPSAVPPDAVILPVYGELKEYAKMLNIERNVITATLRHLGIYTHNIITQEAGQKLVGHLRPNTEVILEELVDDIQSRLPYNRESPEYFKLSSRKPVLCILGHVDHGKTTLLDYLRRSHVAEHEAGGITQSIGAFSIELQKFAENHFVPHYDELVVFDTPGHAAFTGMRQRGAHVVDLAILVVDACDGVKPQTKESLAIIRREKLPFIVAINKMDRPEAEPDAIRRELRELGVSPDEVEMVEISARTGQGVVDLLEMVDILCELEDPRGDHVAPAELVVIEGKKSAIEGTVINALVQDGALKNGDTVLKLSGWDKDSQAKVSRLLDERGNTLDVAGPSTPISFLGFHKHLPEVGTVLIAANDDQHAFEVKQMRETHEYYRNKLKIHARVSSSHPKLHDPTAAMATNYSSVENLAEDDLEVEFKCHVVDDKALEMLSLFATL